ncbi:hypothetical protein [Mammaliicoccus sp. D-M17]|uniref:hypothetical protein n=1 Tax=Mammaliicoccus sp. D-M17 TaxID=2898677 RepID=UPI001EFB380A|nr:hypothetical protein [Mammaliicoccus sp. D-M17]
MKTKKVRNWVIGLIILVMLNIGIVFSFNGFVEAKNACVDNNGTITEQDIGLLGFNWSISCES